LPKKLDLAPKTLELLSLDARQAITPSAFLAVRLGACCGIRTNTSTGWGGRDLLGA